MKKRIVNFIDRVIGLERFLRLIAESKTHNGPTIPREIWRESNSIYGMQQQQGAEKTVQYIEEHMPYAIIFKSMYYSQTIYWELLNFALKKASIPGSIVELGVFKGNSINKLADHFDNKTIHGFDIFETDEVFENTIYLKRPPGLIPNVRKNVVLHRGWFKDTLPEYIKTNKEDISFLHMDDHGIYESSKTAFEVLGPRINPGTIILFNTYFDFPLWWMHTHKAFKEFVKNNNISYEYLAYKGGRSVPGGSDNGSVCIRISSVGN